MAIKYTDEQLTSVDKSMLIQMFLNQQEQLEKVSADLHFLDTKMQLMMQQLILANKNRFGRSSEKMEDTQQMLFFEVDGILVFFNEAEAVCNLDAPKPETLKSVLNVRKKQKTNKHRICPSFLQTGLITTNASHPREFIKDYFGICVTGGYQVYHTWEKEREDLIIAGCWVHARRRFDKALAVVPKERQKDSASFLIIKQIQANLPGGGKTQRTFIRRKTCSASGGCKTTGRYFFVHLKQH